ncbi:MAG TPA: NUDIX hydrolase [Candidatus Binataceae bacterium]|nr:NUDIX hydrolase [Candidatus Binataceae bacterium]
MPRPSTPPVAADVIIEIGERIVLIERLNEPHGWALPGGFVDFGETVEHAAVREMREETSLEVELTDLLGIYSDPKRDPRGQTISVVYIGRGHGALRAADDAKNAALFLPHQPPTPLAFDHATIVSDYLQFKLSGRRPGPWTKDLKAKRQG